MRRHIAARAHHFCRILASRSIRKNCFACGGHEDEQSQCRLPLVAADGGPRGVDDLLQERILLYCIDSDDMTESATTRAGGARRGMPRWTN